MAKPLTDNHRFRVLLWLAGLSICLSLVLGYFTLKANLRLSWLDITLSDTTHALERSDWHSVTSNTAKISDIGGIATLTMPDKWFFHRGDNPKTDYQSMALWSFVPGTHESLIYLFGSSIGVSSFKRYANAEDFMRQSKAMMYESKNTMGQLESFRELSFDGYPAYRVEAEMFNRTSFGIELTKPATFIEQVAYVNGRVIDFNLIVGNYSDTEETKKSIEVFDTLLASVKFIH